MSKKMKPIKLTPRNELRPAMGHEYGKGRSARVHRHKNARRQKDKLRREMAEHLSPYSY